MRRLLRSPKGILMFGIVSMMFATPLFAQKLPAGLELDEHEQLVVVEDDEILVVEADGKNGKDALRSLIPGNTPEAGTSGTSGGSITLLVRQLPEKAYISARGGRGGHGAQGSPGLKGRDGQNGRSARLFRSAKSGTNGGNGGHGGNGSDGGHGGHGGHVRVVYLVEDESTYDRNWRNRFEIDVEAGDAGNEGRGGLGGRGGYGGLGGKKFWSSRRVSSGRNGMPGLSGRDGRVGQIGESGEIEFIEIENYKEFVVDEYFEFDDHLIRNDH